MLRGVLKKCGRCGAGHLFDGWFQQKERCPGCGLKFEREPGFFVGAYLINFAIVIILLFVLCMGFVAMKAIDHDASVAPIVIAGLIIAFVAPVAFYPFSRTIWSAFDVGMTPLEPHEVTDAADALRSANSVASTEV